MDVTYKQMVIFNLIFAVSVIRAEYPLCTKDDLHPELTSCRGGKYRWLFQLPNSETQCKLNNHSLPEKVEDCNQVCDPGEYRNMKSQLCEKCPVGTYSRGNVIRLNEWSKLPEELSVDVTSYGADAKSCESTSFKPEFHFLTGKATNGCKTSLSITVDNQHEGKISFDYTIEDYSTVVIFSIHNERCFEISGSTFVLQYTGRSMFNTVTVPLPEGRSVVRWSLLTMSSLASGAALSTATIRIYKIELLGTPPILHCEPCPAGTYADQDGHSYCIVCPANTYSHRGAKKCTNCSIDEYARPGSAECSPRKPCTHDDYEELWSQCTKQGMQQEQYRWIEPQICTSHNGVSLPNPEKVKTCKRCPVGTYPLNSTYCAICNAERANSVQSCLTCASDKVPALGIFYDVWSRWPPHLTTHCPAEFNCKLWTLGVNKLYVDLGIDERQAGLLQLSIPHGFVHTGLDDLDDVGHITAYPPVPDTHFRMEFSLICEHGCKLSLKQRIQGGNDQILKSWSSSTGRQIYSFPIEDARPTAFTWELQNPHVAELDHSRRIRVEIFQIEVTNTKGMGIIGCRTCMKGIENGTCISCPSGLFYESTTNQLTHEQVVNCTRCPENTIMVSDSHTTRTVHEACHLCEPGTKAVNHSVCVIDTNPATPGGFIYNLTTLLNKNQTIDGITLFTPSGQSYRHEFHFTLAHGKRVRCKQNMNSIYNENYEIEAMICRHSTLRSTTSRDQLYYNPMRLADKLIKALPSNHSKPFWAEVNRNLTRAGWTPDNMGTDLHYMFRSYVYSENCPNGFHSVITLRCSLSLDVGVLDRRKVNITDQYEDMLQVPPSCPDGTCDGCHYQFLWTSVHACPFCNPDQFVPILSECVFGYQEVHWVAPEGCRIPEGHVVFEKRRCPFLTIGQILAVFCASVVVLLLALIIFICHKKNKNLEYKYMKLVQSQEGRGQSTSCVTEDMDDDNLDSLSRRVVNRNSVESDLELRPIGNRTNHVIPKIPLSVLGPILFKGKKKEDLQHLGVNISA